LSIISLIHLSMSQMTQFLENVDYNFWFNQMYARIVKLIFYVFLLDPFSFFYSLLTLSLSLSNTGHRARSPEIPNMRNIMWMLSAN